MNYGFVFDNRKCIGCHACSTACKSENQVPLGVYRTWVKYTEVGNFPYVRRNFQVNRCNHCANPPCVEICPVSAMHQREDGIVGYDADQCIGCKSCMQACPYNSIYIEPESGTAQKCHFCAHRVERGMEPACVVVCPQHAIIAGDLDDPRSEITKTIAQHNVTVRKPEQGTCPKTFYIDGHQAALTPEVTKGKSKHFIWADVTQENLTEAEESAEPTLYFGPGEQMVQTSFNAQHKVPWHWPVPAYLVTKGVSAGIFMLLAAASIYGWTPLNPVTSLIAGLISIVFALLTTLFLVIDLEKPERFLRVVLRPQFKSWLVRGAYILIAFSNLVGLWWLLELLAHLGWFDLNLSLIRPAVMIIGFPLAMGAAMYTAYLFGQAEGRDFWQSPLLPLHFLVQSVLAGSGMMLLAGHLLPLDAAFVEICRHAFGISLGVNLMMILLGEFGMHHATTNAKAAAEIMTQGKYKQLFWIGAMGLGNALPILLLILDAGAAAGLAALAGLYIYEHIFVMAPQEVSNS